MNGVLRTQDHSVRMETFHTLSLDERSSAFNSCSTRIQQRILADLSDVDAVELLDHLDPNRVHRILGAMKSGRRRSRIIARLKKHMHAKIEQFLHFHLRATTSLVHLNYVLLEHTATVGATAEAIEDHVRETGKIPIVLVHENGSLIGEVPFSALVRERNSNKLKNYVRSIATIPYTTPRAEAIEFFTARPHKRAALLDEDGSVLGIMYADDVTALLEETPGAALYDFAGVSEIETVFDGVKSKVRRRYKWLILNLGTAFLAAMTVGLFEQTLEQLVVLAIYMPIVAGMGGNASAQTLAVMVRGLTLGDVTPKTGLPMVAREMTAGLLNGIIVGLVVAAIATFWNGSILLGVVLAAAMIINLFIAGFFGAIVPLIMKSLGKDPATSATIFTTTATDVFGFMAFLGLATLILL
ncbi:MAG: magnesium transporter [Candidatus Paceibacterota bacterium]